MANLNEIIKKHSQVLNNDTSECNQHLNEILRSNTSKSRSNRFNRAKSDRSRDFGGSISSRGESGSRHHTFPRYNGQVGLLKPLVIPTSVMSNGIDGCAIDVCHNSTRDSNSVSLLRGSDSSLCERRCQVIPGNLVLYWL